VTIKTWPALAELVQALEKEDLRALNPAIFDAVADRIEAAMAASDNAGLEEAAANLEDVARLWMAAGTDEARKAMRGDRDASAELMFLVMAGRLAFAQNLASRTLDRRASDTFYSMFNDARYERYICALMSGPKSGKALVEATDETKETVSRKLKVLEQEGVIRRRKNGQITMNLLTPAARQYADVKRLSPIAGGVVAPEVQLALNAKAEALGNHMQSTPVLGDAEPQPAGVR